MHTYQYIKINANPCIFFRPYVRHEVYSETGTTSRKAFEEETSRECVAYAVGDRLWKEGIYVYWDNDYFTKKDFKYTWKPVDCNLKAPFLCQYNPGKCPD